MKDTIQLSTLIGVIARDRRVNVHHLGLYMGLCYWWAQNKCQNPVAITRKNVMEVTRIKSPATYHKYRKALIEFGYIRYHPTYHPDLGSAIYIEELIREDKVKQMEYNSSEENVKAFNE